MGVQLLGGRVMGQQQWWVGVMIACACAVPCAATESTVQAGPPAPATEIQQPRSGKDKQAPATPTPSESGNPWDATADGAAALKPPGVCQSPATAPAPNANPGFNTLEDIVAHVGSVRALVVGLPTVSGLARPVPTD